MPFLETPGLLVPPLTPFDGDGSIDYDRLHDQIEYILECCDPTALVVMGVEAQEYRYLNHTEREEHIRAVSEYLNGRVPFVAGVSEPNPEAAVRLGQAAERNGATAVQALVPARVQGGALRQEELTTYFQRLGSGLNIPIIAYHNPRTGASLSPANLTAITHLDNVVAIKESSRNMRHVLRAIESIDQNGLAQIFTTMELLVPSLVLGGSGATMPPPAAEIGRKIINAFMSGEMDEAVRFQRSFAEFPACWLDWGLTSVMKAALSHINLPIGAHPAASTLPAQPYEELTTHLNDLPIGGPNADS